MPGFAPVASFPVGSIPSNSISVSITGVVGTSETFGRAFDALEIVIYPVGLDGTAEFNSFVVDANANINLSGVQATAVEDAVSLHPSVTLLGVTATSGFGTLVAEIDARLLGISATSALNLFSPSGSTSTNVSLVGIASTGTPGAFVPSLSVLSIVGVAATTSVGSMTTFQPIEILLVSVYTIMRDNPVPVSGVVSNTAVACQGNLWTD